MKSSIHPIWHHNAVVTCACGNSFETGSTLETLQVDICSKCHPFFTGEVRFVDRQGRVDRFMQKMQVAQQKQSQGKGKTKAAATPEEAKEDPKSYQEILREQQTQLRKAKAA
jgi:large subunit ribosomal protein L31